MNDCLKLQDEEFQTVLDALESTYERVDRDYSGRGMYGDTCVAITDDRDEYSDFTPLHEFVLDAVEYDDVDPGLLRRALRGVRMDSMGLGVVHELRSMRTE